MWDLMSEFVSDAALGFGALRTKESKEYFWATIAITVWLRLVSIIIAGLAEIPGVW